MNYPKTILWSGVIAAFCLTGAAYAQNTSVDKDATQANKADVAKTDQAPSFDNLLAFNDAAPQQNAAEDQNGQVQQLGTIQASGLAFSMKQSLAREKNASTNVSTITATDIGTLPATNVAEALRRLPGVTIDNNFPIQQRVTIDGISPNLNMTLLNGHGVSQTRWFYANSPNRGFNFSMLPTELVGSIDVHKTYEASMPAGGLGGTIVVHTLDPLTTKANSIAGSIGVLYNAQSKNTDPNAALVYSTHNEDSSFGFLVALSHFENDYVRQGREAFGYPTLQTDATFGPNPWLQAQIDSGKLDGDWLLPAEVNRAHFAQDEKRDAAFVSVKWAPTEALSTGLNLLYLQNGASNYNTSLYPVGNPWSWGGARVDAVTPPVPGSDVVQQYHVAGVACTAAVQAAGTCPNARATQEDFNARNSKIKTEGVDLTVEYSGASWGLSADVGFNDSANTANGEYASHAIYTGGFTTNTLKGWKWDDPEKAQNGDYWLTASNPSYARVPTKQRQNYAKVKFSVDLNSVINKLQFGIRYHNTWVSQYHFGYNNSSVEPAALSDYPTALMEMSAWTDAFSDWRHGISLKDKAAVKQMVLGGTPTPGGKTVQELIDSDDFTTASVQTGSYGVHQLDEEAFFQADFTNYNNLSGNFGVRFVHVKNDMTNPADVPAGQVWDGTWVSSSGTSSTLLPAFNIAYKPARDVVLRGAMSETIGFIGFGSLNNATFLNDSSTALSGTAGNTHLKPYKSVNTSVEVAWYFTPQSVLSAHLFNRHIINYIHDSVVTQVLPNQSFSGYNAVQRAGLIGAGCTQTGPDSANCPYAITQPVNGGTARATGFTVAWLQAFGDSGFGINTSYTFVDGENGEGGALPYNSRDTYSISPFYSKGPINASIGYTWRSKYQGAGYIAGAAAVEIGAYHSLNASFSYAFTDHLTLQLSGTNLSNSMWTSYYNQDPYQSANNYYDGAVYQAKLRFKF